MKESTSSNTVESSEAFKEFSFGIKESGLAHILGILRSKLYSNKVLCVIREYACNAKDANVEARRADKPIEITLPSPLDMNLRVRDFGLGLSQEDVKEIYINYGESTKRNTNKAIGMLGIGSKAGFAYGDNFLVTSFFGGKKTVYNCYIDPTKIGKCALISEEKSDEPEGVEITVPVRDGDEEKFLDESVGLFKYWKVQPILKGVAPLPDLSRPAPRFSGNGWQVNDGKPVAVMGGVPYDIHGGAIPGLDEKEVNFVRLGLEMDFAIGEVDISANRETLEYTEKTIKAIHNRIKRANKEMVDEAKKAIAAATTYFEAVWAYGSLPEEVRKSCKLEFDGKPLDHDYFSWKNSGVNSYRYYKNYSGKLKNNYDKCMRAGNGYWIADAKRIRDRVRKIMETKGTDEVLVIQEDEKGNVEEWAKEHGIDLSKFARLSTIDVPKRTRAANGDGETRKAYGMMKWVEAHRGYNSLSDCCVELEEDEDVDCYVTMEERKIHYRNELLTYREFHDRVKNLASAIGKFTIAVVPIKKVDKVDKEWQTIVEFAKEKLEETVEAKGAMVWEQPEIPYRLHNLSPHVRKELGTHDVVTWLEGELTNPNSELIHVAGSWGIKVPKKENGMKELSAKIRKNYPLLWYLEYSVNTKMVCDYIRAMDAYQPIKEVLAETEKVEA